MYLFQYKRLKSVYQAATSLQTGRTYRGYFPTNQRGIPWLRPHKQEGHTVATSLQTGWTYRGLRPYKQEEYTVAQPFILRPVTADVRVRSKLSLYGIYGE
jgi:hypothetical protein